MSEARSIVVAMHEAFNARRFDRYAELLDEDVLMLLGGEDPVRGRAAVTEYAAALARDAPAVRVELEEILVESEDAVVARKWAVAGFSSEPGPGGSSDGRLPISFCELTRIGEGRIVELRYYTDRGSPGAGLGTARLVTEQSALRRVATLVAGGAAPSEVFEAIVAEAVKLLGTEVWLFRYEPDGAARIIAHDSRLAGEELEAASYVPPGGAMSLAFRLRRAVRHESYTGEGPIPDLARRLGVTASAAAPMMVQGRPWGGLLAVVRGVALEPGIEDRLAFFAELAATAVSNAQSRSELQLLAEEQAALRRVAELVARGGATQEVFDQVTVEASRVLNDSTTVLRRYERAGAEAVVVARSATWVAPPGTRIPVTGDIGIARVWRTRQVARIDDYHGVAGAEVIPRRVRASVSAPIVVEGRLWGVLMAHTVGAALPAGTEERLTRFCDLVAAAIANAESRAAVTASRARIVASADEARRRLARDVHDGAQQRLVHALISLKQAQAALAPADGSAEELVAESLRHAQSAYDELRRLAHGILPAALEHGGLQTAVEALVADIPLPVKTEVVDWQLPEAVETTAYFVVAEALTNVVKHAAAGRASVRAMPEGDWLALEISDDGCGDADAGRGSGLIGLSDRVQAAGGTITVSSPPGAGTRVSVRLPLTAPNGAHTQTDDRA